MITKRYERKIGTIFYPSILSCVFGAQNNCLIETVILSTHNICFGWESKDYFLITHTYLMAWIAVCFCSKWKTWPFWNCPAHSGHSHIFRQSENSYFAQYISRIIHMLSGNQSKQTEYDSTEHVRNIIMRLGTFVTYIKWYCSWCSWEVPLASKVWNTA